MYSVLEQPRQAYGVEADAMYRIRSATGTEAVYNSLEEFHAAVRNGQVAPEDEIFHSRANRWLDVKSHPHYRSVIGWLGNGDVAIVTVKPTLKWKGMLITRKFTLNFPKSMEKTNLL